MKRSELYAKVWATPMSRLAIELGISDVGLAKACRRHAIPAPPRGYWAKLKAGQKPKQTQLPTPELDIVVRFERGDPQERARLKEMKRERDERVKAAAEEVGARFDITFAESLDNAHPLVKATKRYCERLPRIVKQYQRRGLDAWSTTKPEDRPPGESYGRYSLLHQSGLLNVTASLDLMEWVLLFHASVFKGLTGGGMVIARREATTGRRSRDREDGPAVEAKFKGEVFAIEFSQGYRRVYLDTDELEEKRKKNSWARAFEQQPSQNLTFRLVASEYGASKTWQGTREKLQGQVAEIVRAAFELVPLQIELRKQRQLAEAEAQRAAEVRARVVRRAGARAEQVTQAFLIAKTDADVRQLEDFLHRLEEEAAQFKSPFDERVRTWIMVVRNELARRDPVEKLLGACLSVPSWKTWPPDWWPGESNAPDQQPEEGEDFD
jgi:hypothetical protein